jgi:hypothetical protein
MHDPESNDWPLGPGEAEWALRTFEEQNPELGKALRLLAHFFVQYALACYQPRFTTHSGTSTNPIETFCEECRKTTAGVCSRHSGQVNA